MELINHSLSQTPMHCARCRWEDEQEFDAITEVLLPKRVHLVTPAQCASGGALHALRSCRLAGAFAAPSAAEQAQQLWQGLGRAGPPLFLKVRTREALDSLAVRWCRGGGGVRAG